jgi:16S rRNA (uracil1498-N3)-methyltransferase
MGNRFFVEQPIDAPRAVLGGIDAHHLRHVLRARRGDQVVLFDGTGREFVARVESLDRSGVELAILDSMSVDRELPRTIVVGVCFPKADRQRWLVEKLVELGVSRVVPLRSARSVVHPDERALGKLQRTVIEASKQCGRNRLMDIGELTGFQDFVRAVPADVTRWLADPAADQDRIPAIAGGGAALLVGPEGGFTAEEAEIARQLGWHSVSLGPRTLRIETACLALATLATVGQASSLSRMPGESTKHEIPKHEGSPKPE